MLILVLILVLSLLWHQPLLLHHIHATMVHTVVISALGANGKTRVETKPWAMAASAIRLLTVAMGGCVGARASSGVFVAALPRTRIICVVIYRVLLPVLPLLHLVHCPAAPLP